MTSLSFTAEALLGALGREVLGETSPRGWLVALVAADPELAEEVASGQGLQLGDLLVAPADPVTDTLTRSAIATAATRRADAEGRDVANRVDVAAVIVEAAVQPAQGGPGPVDTAEEAPTASSTRPRTFRLFVSSTFKDLEAERNVLHQRVYPALAALCAEQGARFQPIDLRWGVSEEASLDQQAMSICLDEIARCRAVTPRPNFLVLLGNRYGWLALPSRIPAAEWAQIVERVAVAEDRELLTVWYQLDENAGTDGDGGEYRLRPRSGPWAPPGHQPTEPTDDDARRKLELERWEAAEDGLRRILTAAVAGLDLDDERRRVHTTSATEQEIRAGALRDDAAGASFGFIREIALTVRDPDPRTAGGSDPITTYVDPDEVGRLDERAGALASLKRDLQPRIVGRYTAGWRRATPTAVEAAQPVAEMQLDPRDVEVLEGAGIRSIGDLTSMSASELEREVGVEHPSIVERIRDALDREGLAPRGEGDRPTADHLDHLADEVLATLTAAIEEELRHPAPAIAVSARRIRIEPHPHLDDEGEAHRDFAEERIQHFVGRTTILEQVADYLTASDALPLVVHGGGGTGKSALMAEALRREQERHTGSTIVYRFIGASPGSVDGQALLGSICRELARCDGGSEADVPSDFQELTFDFAERLSAATAARPLVVLIDSLDQLSPRHGARRLGWIPSQLPDHVRLVVSTRPGDTLEPLRSRLTTATGSAARLVEVDPMGRNEGDELLGRWLADVGRRLQAAQREAVLDAFEEAHGNPLYLRLAFEEARRWISEQTPEALHTGDPVADGEEPGDVEAIIEHNTFARLAHEQNHGEVLVSHALGYLAASRYGLAEDELLDLLSADPDVYGWFVLNSFHVPLDLRERLEQHLSSDETRRLQARARERAADSGEPPMDPVSEWVRQLRDGERGRQDLDAFLEGTRAGRGAGLRLPVVLWSRLHADLSPYLVERTVEGAIVIAFYHRELLEVARRCFLPEGDGDGRVAATTLHGRMADYFARLADPTGQGTWAGPTGHVDLRGLSELPYHLTMAERWDDVYDTLTDFTFLEQKVASVDVAPVGHGEDATTLYRGVFALQEDFDTALEAMPGAEDGSTGRRRLIVTAVDLGAGLSVRCPHCNTTHPFSGECSVCKVHHDLADWRGRARDCPAKGCGGPLKVNDFVVERS